MPKPRNSFEPRKPYTTVSNKQGRRDERDREIYKAYVAGTPITDLSALYDMSRPAIIRIVDRIGEKDNSLPKMPTKAELTQLRRLYRKTARYQKRLEYIRELPAEQQESVKNERIQLEIFLAHRRGTSMRDLRDRFGYAQVSIDLIIRRLSK